VQVREGGGKQGIPRRCGKPEKSPKKNFRGHKGWEERAPQAWEKCQDSGKGGSEKYVLGGMELFYARQLDEGDTCS